MLRHTTPSNGNKIPSFLIFLFQFETAAPVLDLNLPAAAPVLDLNLTFV
jgi:hypothetical protein